jgi:hypothetical protein
MCVFGQKMAVRSMEQGASETEAMRASNDGQGREDSVMHRCNWCCPFFLAVNGGCSAV